MNRAKRLSPILADPLLKRRAKQAQIPTYKTTAAVNRYVFRNPFAFFVGVIADQSMPAGRAWSLPFKLRERIGGLTPRLLASIESRQLKRHMCRPTPLHIYPNRIGMFIWEAAQRICHHYGGIAEKIWETDSACELYDRLLAFRGVGEKKASMMIKMLISDWGLRVRDTQKIKLPYDIHVRRVLLRSGVIKKDLPREVERIGAIISPTYPAAVDNQLWFIGSHYCHARKPNCLECPIRSACARKNISRTQELD